MNVGFYRIALIAERLVGSEMEIITQGSGRESNWRGLPNRPTEAPVVRVQPERGWEMVSVLVKQQSSH